MAYPVESGYNLSCKRTQSSRENIIGELRKIDLL